MGLKMFKDENKKHLRYYKKKDYLWLTESVNMATELQF